MLSRYKMSLIFQIALRALFSRRSRYTHSAIGWIAVVGLILGVASQSVAVSILDGFEKSLTQSILGFNAHLVLTHEGGFSLSSSPLEKIQPYLNPKDVRELTPFLYREGLIHHHGKVKGVVFKGVDPLTFQKVYRLQVRAFSDTSPLLLMGSDLADFLGVTAEDCSVSVFSPKGNITSVSDTRQFKKLSITGTFSTGLYEYDSQFILMDLKKAQEFFEASDQISGYEMRVGDFSHASSLAERMETELGDGFEAISWDALNADIFLVLRWEKKIFFIIMGLIVGIAATNLVGLILIMITSQRKEISILKALGMSARNLQWIFTIQGMTLGLLGVTLGSGLGSLFSYFLSTHPWFQLNKEWYLVSSLPLSLSWSNFAQVFLFSLTLSFIVTRLAARRILRTEMHL